MLYVVSAPCDNEIEAGDNYADTGGSLCKRWSCRTQRQLPRQRHELGTPKSGEKELSRVAKAPCIYAALLRLETAADDSGKGSGAAVADIETAT